MPIAADLENRGLIYGGPSLACEVGLAQTGPLELTVINGRVRVPEFGDRVFELPEDVVIDCSPYVDATYPVGVVIDLVLDAGGGSEEFKVLVEKVVKDGPEDSNWPGGRRFGVRRHSDLARKPDPADPQRGGYRYTRRTSGGPPEPLPDRADVTLVVRLVGEGWFVIPAGATELPTISYLKVVDDLELVKENRRAKQAALGV